MAKTKPVVLTAMPHVGFNFGTKSIRLDRILLDPNNYRFLDLKKFKKKALNRFHETAVQKATLDHLEQAYQLDELKKSILTNGYVPMERIIVVPYVPKPGLFVVVEGNRRVASLKLLLKEEEEGVLRLSAAQRKSYSSIPCAILKSKGDALKHAERVIMGIRHIAGPREWGAYQQALLVSELKDQESLEFKEIGDMLGISSVEAARRYKAIRALKHMEDDELYGAKAEPAFYRLLHELVSLPDVRERFGWSHDENRFTDSGKAQEFFALITADGKKDAKLQTYSDVRKLKSIIGNAKAEESLFEPKDPLIDAIRFCDDGKAKNSASDLLDDAYNSLSSIGFMEAVDLNADNLSRIDELIGVLKNLKKTATSPKKK